jgi:hypothetical protein
VVTWDELINACGPVGQLRHKAAVTPDDLCTAVGFSPEAAALLLADVAQAAAAATALVHAHGALPAGAEEKLNAAASYYGMGLPQGPKLSEAALEKLRRSYPVFARAIEEGEIERARVAGAFVENAFGGGGGDATSAAAQVEALAAEAGAEEDDDFDKTNPPVCRAICRCAARVFCCARGGAGGAGAAAENPYAAAAGAGAVVVENPYAAAATGAASAAAPPPAPAIVSPFSAYDVGNAPPISEYSAAEFGEGGGELPRQPGGVVRHEEQVLALFSHASARRVGTVPASNP